MKHFVICLLWDYLKLLRYVLSFIKTKKFCIFMLISLVIVIFIEVSPYLNETIITIIFAIIISENTRD